MAGATFAIIAGENIGHREKALATLDKDKERDLEGTPRQACRQGVALVIAGERDVFAVVGCLHGTSLHEDNKNEKTTLLPFREGRALRAPRGDHPGNVERHPRHWREGCLQPVHVPDAQSSGSRRGSTQVARTLKHSASRARSSSTRPAPP